jgi:hypothetical protein
MRREMRRIAEEIRGAFEAAGWGAGEPIGEEEAESMELVIRAEASKYAIVAPRSVLVLDQPIFELFDTDSDTAIWVRKIPNPQRAAELLARYGVPADEADTIDTATPPSPPMVPVEEDR